MSIHEGHRDRLKTRFLNEGLDSFTPVQVLELMLFYSIPRQDTNEIAHRLIKEFGSFSQVLEADVEELVKVDGVGKNTATLLKLLPEVGRYYGVDRSKMVDIPLTTIEQCGEYLRPFFRGRCNETVFLLCLDAKCKVLGCRMVGEGSINSAAVPIRRVVEIALAAKATSVVLAHNHPSGIALPSNEDCITTKRIAAALSTVEVLLTDHLVIADDDYVSMVQSGWYRPGREVL
jgi:DNA repair protein RadC